MSPAAAIVTLDVAPAFGAPDAASTTTRIAFATPMSSDAGLGKARATILLQLLRLGPPFRLRTSVPIDPRPQSRPGRGPFGSALRSRVVAGSPPDDGGRANVRGTAPPTGTARGSVVASLVLADMVRAPRRRCPPGGP